MKHKSLILVSLLVTPFCLFAQQWNGSTNTINFITRDGDIRLHDNQSWRVTLGPAWGEANIGYGTGYLGFNLARNNHSDGNWTFFNDGANNGATVIYGNIFGDLLFSNKLTTGNTNGTLTDADIKNNIRMKIQNDGKVIIGNSATMTSPGTYKLYVETGILTEKVKIALKAGSDWADFVFNNDYKLMSLQELELYIKKNKHLPGIPTTNQVLNEGVDLGKMTAKLLEKIEELTLYVIQLNNDKQKLQKDIQLLQAKSQPDLQSLQQQIDSMKEEIQRLKSK